MQQAISQDVRFKDLSTKKARLELIKTKLVQDDRWMLYGLIKIYNNQTKDEKDSTTLREHNGIGFTAFDTEILTSFAKQVIGKGIEQAILSKRPIQAKEFLSPGQERVLRGKITKYAGQLARIAEVNHPIIKKVKNESK